MVAEKKAVHEPTVWTSLTQTDLATATAECPPWQQQRPCRAPDRSRGERPNSHMVANRLPLQFRKFQQLILIGTVTYSWDGSLFSHQKHSLGCSHCLINQHGILHHISSDQETHFMAKEV